MSKFLRFLKGKKKSNKKDELDSCTIKRLKDTDIECKVVHLDNTIISAIFEKKVLGNVLEDYVYHSIENIEYKNYFGLQFKDSQGTNHWLDTKKQIRKQCLIGPPYSFRFRVKFFSSDPTGQINDEYTVYLFVLQLRQMIRDGELLCEDLELASQLAALWLQGELGDFNEKEHTPYFISQYRFLPEHQQTEEFELLVQQKYKEFKDRSIVPMITDRQYLQKCHALPDYGVDRHNTKNKDGKDFVLGLTPSGIFIYEDNVKIGFFQWSQVTKLSFTKNLLRILVQNAVENENGTVDLTFEFQSVDAAACKQLWKSCIEHHTFYRLEGSHKPPTKIQQFFRLKSRFHASFHTEYQIATKNNFGTSIGRSSTFTRAPSVRLAPRASFEKNEIERRKIQQKYRDKVRVDSKEYTSKMLESGEYLDCDEYTYVPIINKPLLAISEMDVTENMQQIRIPRLLSQDSSNTRTSTLSRRSSAESTVSETSGVVDLEKTSPTHETSLPCSPIKPNDESNEKNKTTKNNNANSNSKLTHKLSFGLSRKGSKKSFKWRFSRETNNEDIIPV